jgi:chaperonin GroES
MNIEGNISVFGRRVLIKPSPNDEKTASGLLLAKNSQEKKSSGVVVALGSGDNDSGGFLYSLLRTLGLLKPFKFEQKVGDKIIYDKFSDTIIEYEGEQYVIIHTDYIIGKIQ